MEQAFVVYHTISRGDCDSVKIIGVYSSRVLAERAVERLRKKPGFRSSDGEFTIGPYQVDNDYWADGFGIDDD